VSPSLDIVFLGLSITSSWGNGHATTYRGLVRELVRLGHRVLFLERDVPWYAANRDLPRPPDGRTELYASIQELKDRFATAVAEADLVVVGSYVPDGIQIGRWAIETARGVVAFYDIDTPVTLAKLSRGECEYLARGLIPRYDLYLSFTGGPVLSVLEQKFGARAARPLYCSVDPELYQPARTDVRWDFGYLGTYSADRQHALDALMLEAARSWRDGRFVVAGPQYPHSIEWPRGVDRIEHIAPPEHAAFYAAQRFTLNVTRADMIKAGHSPSVRLFEAAACGVPVISDLWPGIEEFFEPGSEILLARSGKDVLRYLREMREPERRLLGIRARERVLRAHTAAHRARALVAYLDEIHGREKALA
jgi:spore maturation protein CgeB